MCKISRNGGREVRKDGEIDGGEEERRDGWRGGRKEGLY